MYGGKRQRYCGECNLNVYNLSEMTKREAENLIMNAEGKLCGRFYRRTDGTVITKDCPVGWAAFKRNVSRLWTAAASIAITALSAIGITSYLTKPTVEYTEMGTMAIDKPLIPLKPINRPEMIMGEMIGPDNDTQPKLGRIAASGQ